MIANLRKKHNYYFLVLSPVLIVLFSLSLYYRPNFLSSSELPASLEREPVLDNRASLVKEGKFSIKDALVSFAVWKLPTGPMLVLNLKGFIWQKPDLLLYWEDNKEKNLTSLSPKAILLGSLEEKAYLWFSLPATYEIEKGIFVIYSLAHSEVFASFDLGN